MVNTTIHQYGTGYDIQTVEHTIGHGLVLDADESIAHWSTQMKKPESDVKNQQKCNKCGRIVGCDYRGRKRKCKCQPEQADEPAECGDYECQHCPLYYDEMGRKQIGCPYVD